MSKAISAFLFVAYVEAVSVIMMLAFVKSLTFVGVMFMTKAVIGMDACGILAVTGE